MFILLEETLCKQKEIARLKGRQNSQKRATPNAKESSAKLTKCIVCGLGMTISPSTRSIG